MRKKFDVALRGHHLMLLYMFCFWGGPSKVWSLMALYYGYGVKHAEDVLKGLEKILRPNTRIKITDNLDDVCSTCRIKKVDCNSRKKAERDTRIAEYAGLEVGRVYSVRQILRKLKKLKRYNFSRFYRRQSLLEKER